MDSTFATGARGAPARSERATAGGSVWVGAYLWQAGVADGICAFAAGLAMVVIRAAFRNHVSLPHAMFAAALPLLWWISVALAGGYDPRIIGAGSAEFRRVFNAGVGLIAAAAIVSFATRSPFGRYYVEFGLPCATVLDLGARYALRKRLHVRRRRGACIQRTVAVGHAHDVAALIAGLRRETSHGISVVAACVAGELPADGIAGIPVYGGLDSVTDVAASCLADTVAVTACPELSGHGLRMLAWQLEKTGTRLCLAPALVDIAAPRTTIRPAAGFPLLQVDGAALTGLRCGVKAVLDRVIAALALLLLAPVMAATALVVKLSDPGPALFRQQRIGRDGRPFPVYKFRTMIVGAEALKAQLLAANEMNGVLFKIRNDPRLTRPGAWLRRWSVDELPQLLNVLRGEMSLVGPRPWTARPYQEAAGEDEAVWRRLAVKPGITGLWQVSGRANLPWQESVRLDVRYIENWSLGLDLRILLRTATAVFRRSGAY